MELCIEGSRFKKVVTNSTIVYDISLGSIKSFIFNPVMVYPESSECELDSNFYSTRDIEQVLFISGPEQNKTEEIFER